MRVAVFTGSSPGPAAHSEAARKFGQRLAEAGIGIVYGGGKVGLMGVVADAALAAGGEVIGVIPQHMVDIEVGHHGLTRLEIVPGMHERKARMAEQAGFEALWISDHFHPWLDEQGQSSFVWAVIGAIS